MQYRAGDLLPFLTRGEVDLVHEKSVELLSRIGFRFAQSSRAIELFRKHSFRTEGDIVFFSEGQIREALSLVPSSFRVKALNPAKDFIMGGGETVFSNAAAPAFIHDESQGRREAVKDDFINFLKIAQQLPLLKLIRPMFDISGKPGGKFSWLIRWALEYTDKAISGSSLTDVQLVAAAFDLSKKAMRRKSADGEVHVVGVCNPKSPFTLEKSNTDFCMDQAEWGAAIKISPVPTAGMTGPVTLPGLIIQQNAEVLAPMVLAQLVCPGVPVIYGVLSTTSDFRTMQIAASPPELTGPIFRAGIQMARHYGMPSRVDVGNTNSCALDYQAGAESSLMLANAVLSGSDLSASLGSLESRGIGSLEKLVLDHSSAEEMMKWIRVPDFPEMLSHQVNVDSPPRAVAEMLEKYRKPEILSAAKLQELDTIIEKGQL
jgi:trimethylamine---corrinoid protein Co-methyltransferase